MMSPPPTLFYIDHADFMQALDRSQVYHIEVCSLHGKTYTETQVWTVMADLLFLYVPGSDPLLAKRSFKCPGLAYVGARIESDLAWAKLLLRRRRHVTRPSAAWPTRCVSPSVFWSCSTAVSSHLATRAVHEGA